MRISKLSPKQKLAMNWWNNEQYRSYDAVICDGAVRSGKTVTALRRNVIAPLMPLLRDMGIQCSEKVSRSYFDVSLAGRSNRFYLFGGRDEGSAALIQGMTLSGVFFDEVVLMPRSFVEQALARCSVSGSRMWFCCDPENPGHWFYREWIKKAEEKNALYLHFTMDDNPSLSERVKSRYERLYSGAFYDRFVLGKWAASEGVVYPMFSPEKHVFSGEKQCERFVISCDYGTVNPSSFGLWGLSSGVWYRLREYYYSSKREGALRTDEEHYAALEELAGGHEIEKVIVDPSAASFIECIRRHGKFRVAKADNDVITGIRRVSAALKEGRLMFHESCGDIIREFSLYRWSEKSGADVPVKENDHAMDDLRYFVSDLSAGEDEGFFALSVTR